jgi:hypothetical protein
MTAIKIRSSMGFDFRLSARRAGAGRPSDKIVFVHAGTLAQSPQNG